MLRCHPGGGAGRLIGCKAQEGLQIRSRFPRSQRPVQEGGCIKSNLSHQIDQPILRRQIHWHTQIGPNTKPNLLTYLRQLRNRIAVIGTNKEQPRGCGPSA